MAATEPERLALHAAARATLGEQEGDTLMAITAPADHDIATRQDVERAEERLGARIEASEDRTNARIQAFEDRTNARIEASEDRINARIQASEDRTNARIDHFAAVLAAQIERSELSTRLWGLATLIASQIAVVTYLTSTLG